MCRWLGTRVPVAVPLGTAAVRAQAEERELAAAELVAGRVLDPAAEVAERFVVDVRDGAAALAHDVVVEVLAHRLVEGAVGAEVGAADESLAIPIYAELTAAQQESVVAAIGQFVHQRVGASR